MVRDQLLNQYSEARLNSEAFRVYTTLDLDLQRAATEAVHEGMRLVDEQVSKQNKPKKPKGEKNPVASAPRAVRPVPQVAMVSPRSHNGDVLAIVGGRNYSASQLNHAVAKRPTGSIFKPFVYAAAINSALSGRTFAPDPEDTEAANAEPGVFTSMTRVNDAQVSIPFGDEVYEPRNYHERFHGFVSARYALAQSLNNATVKIAQMVGFGNVANLAKSAGISSVQATPAIALGAYDATPMEMAGAYSVFANQGMRVAPRLMES